MVQPGRQEHQLDPPAGNAAIPPRQVQGPGVGAGPVRRTSLAQSFLQRLKVLDFASQAVLFGSAYLFRCSRSSSC